jgi:predicted amidophosphoribosyltransferase
MALMAIKTIINQGREKSRFGSRLPAALASLMKLLVPPACLVCYAPFGDDDGLCATCWLDVLTTGATVEAMLRILRRAGAAPIYVVTAARVVLPERV